MARPTLPLPLHRSIGHVHSHSSTNDGLSHIRLTRSYFHCCLMQGLSFLLCWASFRSIHHYHTTDTTTKHHQHHHQNCLLPNFGPQIFFSLPVSLFFYRLVRLTGNALGFLVWPAHSNNPNCAVSLTHMRVLSQVFQIDYFSQLHILVRASIKDNSKLDYFR